jgi:hypothetical protein
MTFEIPSNASPASPVTYEWLQDYMESQSQEAAAIAAIAGGFPGPGASDYLGWSAPVWHATSTASLSTGDIYVVAVYVPVAGTTTYMDVDATTEGTVSVADAGLFTLAGVRLAEALTANLTTNSAAWGAGINTWEWTSPVALTAGVYYATIETTSSGAPSLAASPASPVINFNLPANQYNYATYSTGTVPSAITPSSLSGAVTAQPWVGIR